MQVETGETIVEAAAREVREECGYIVRTEDLGELMCEMCWTMVLMSSDD